jgi:hypothetical protein
LKSKLSLLALVAILTACGVPSVTINVHPESKPLTPTPSIGIAYRPAQQPDVVYLPTPRSTPTPIRGGAVWMPTPTTIPRRAVSASGPATIGQTISAWGWGFRCTGSEAPGATLAWSSAGNRLGATGSWAVVTIEMTNTQPMPQAVRAEDFAVRDGQLRVYRATSALGATDFSAFRGGQQLGEPVPPGAMARFYLVFDVAADARGLRLIFTGSRPAADGFEASFDLGR